MSETTGDQPGTDEMTWPASALTPYIAVSDGRRAIEWYATVLGARQRGEAYEMPDGSIGHAELAIGNAVLMLAEGSDEVPVRPPTGSGPHSHSLYLQVTDVDAMTRRVAEHGGSVEREPEDQSYGRVAVIVDPFGHRWMFNRPPRGQGAPVAPPG